MVCFTCCTYPTQLLVCVGVAQATNADLSTSSIGLVYAALGVLVTAFYQIVRRRSRMTAQVVAVTKKIYNNPHVTRLYLLDD